MRSPILSSLLSVSCMLSALTSVHAQAAKAPPFVDLFDGKTLAGFERKGGKAVYRVEDGCIVGNTVPRTPNSFLCTKRDYGDFVLDYEFKIDGTLNSGVQIRSHSIPSHRKGRVHGYQVEIDPDVKRNRMWTAGIYDEARRGWIFDLKNNEPARKAFKPDAWNKIRVAARGDSIKTWLNGVPAADLVDSMTLTGLIGLQVHGVGNRKEQLEVRWRNLRIQDLGRHVWSPLWDGKSMRGWTQHGGGKWSIEDGVLVARNEKSERQHGHLFLDAPQSDFTVRLKYKAIRGNSGLYFRSKQRKGAIGITGFQAEIDAAKDAGGLYETGGRAWVAKPKPKAVAKYFKPGAWNQMTVSAHGRRIVVHVNGTKTAELPADKGRLAGKIALQLHGSQDVEVHFKDIEILASASPGPSSKPKGPIR
ncbi:MAG: DUF1080 domain-containing protein [Planctomycetota bacterium]|nr:DUF1080 domain-containing protein [Planctomycetota bacterium]